VRQRPLLELEPKVRPGKARPEQRLHLSPAVAALALRVWGRLHGLVTLEVHGHLRPVFNDPATLFEAELLDAVG
jgi:hypothetical protein